MPKRPLTLLLLALICISAASTERERHINKQLPDSAMIRHRPKAAVATADSVPDSTRHLNLIQRVIKYFDDSNKPKANKAFDWSIIGGPHYSSDTRLGLGLVAAGTYRHDLSDTITQPSNVSLYGDISTVGFYLIGLRGNHIFAGDKNRIDYDLYFYSFPRYFWGIGYDQGLNMDNKSKFNEIYVNAHVSYLHALSPGLFIGPTLDFAYSHAAKMARPELWQGMPFHSSTYTVGGIFQYDTRDNLTETQNGLLASLEQNFSPRFLGNSQAFSSTEIKVAYFHKLWKGSILASQYHARLAYGNVPWAMLSTFGGSHSMRGYYEGRFRDKGEMDLTLELRQHVWRRNGLVVWGGVGTIFPKLSKMRLRHILPNGGVGYRWEFKQRTNVRLDYGFGRGESSFIFSINEAF